MTAKASIEDVLEMVGVQLGKRLVKPGDRFMEDLGAESADLVNITAAAEDKFKVTFDETRISGIRTVKELCELINQS